MAQSRRRIIRTFRRSFAPVLIDRARKMDECGSSWGAALHPTEPSRSRAVPWKRCKDRFCPTCRRARATYYARRAEAYIAQIHARGRRAKMLVLTVRSRFGDPIQETRRKLYDAFNKLKRHKAWKAHVLGGVSFEEVVSRADETDAVKYHVHLHVLLDAVYWPQAEISAAWLRASSGESSIVWIGALRSPREAAKYVTTPESLPDESLVEYALATHGRRLVRPFGDVYGVAMSEAEAWKKVERDDEAPGFQRVSLGALWESAHFSDVRQEHARAVALSLVLHGARSQVPEHWLPADTVTVPEVLR